MVEASKVWATDMCRYCLKEIRCGMCFMLGQVGEKQGYEVVGTGESVVLRNKNTGEGEYLVVNGIKTAAAKSET